MLRHSSSRCAGPAGAIPAAVDVYERSVPAASDVNAYSTHKFRVVPFDPLGRGGDHPGIPDVDPAVPVEVIHRAIPVVVDEDVGGVAVHMAAQAGTPPGIP